MEEKRMCPHCGSQMFMSKVIRPCLVEVTTDPNEPYKVLKENKDKFEIEIVGCARCRESVTEKDLVTGVKCKECGRIVSPMDVNEEHICNVCVAIKQRAELANASREDLIQMLLSAEKKVNPVAIKMEKQIEKANTTTEEVHDDTEQPSTDDKKPKRKASRRKKEDTVDDIPQEDEEQVSEETEAVEDIANQQEAPFPDLSMNLQEENIQTSDSTVIEEPEIPLPVVDTQEEQSVGADFHMFEEDEDAF